MGFLIALYQVSFLEGWGLVGAFFFFFPIPKVRPEAHTPTEEGKGLSETALGTPVSLLASALSVLPVHFPGWDIPLSLLPLVACAFSGCPVGGPSVLTAP